jgi:hypothetical protein
MCNRGRPTKGGGATEFFPLGTNKNVNWKTEYIIPKFSILCWQSYFSWNYKNYNLFQPVPYALSGKNP